MARLDLHDWNGFLISRTKANTSETKKGVMMVDNLIDKFGLTEDKIGKIRLEILETSKKEIQDLKKTSGEPILKERIIDKFSFEL